MKTNRLLLGLLALMVGCQKTPDASVQPCPDASEQMGIISFSITGEDNQLSKAIQAYTDALPYETNINHIDLCVLDSRGKLMGQQRFTGSYSNMQFSLRYGDYTVYAFANFSRCPNLADSTYLYDLCAGNAVSLTNFSIANSNFPMSGKATFSVSKAQGDCSISLSRLCGRVFLENIYTDFADPDELVRIKTVFLSNLSGACFIDGKPISMQDYENNCEASCFYNVEGYQACESEGSIYRYGSKITSASQSWCKELTAYDIDEPLYDNDNLIYDETVGPRVLLYSLASAATAAPSGYHESFTEQYTSLVIYAKYDGQDTYYVVPIKDFSANNTYTVSVTITGPGSDDPNTTVTKGNMSFSVSVSPWSTGEVIEKTI